MAPSNTDIKTMVQAYFDEPTPTMFLSELFQSPAQNFFNTPKVEFDIVRSGKQIAIAIQDMSVGSRMNTKDIYTTKEVTPPVFDEGIALNSWELMERQPGQNAFEDPNFRTQIINRMVSGMRAGQEKIMRTIELQGSQVLQTGTVTLIDSNGVANYAIDYKPKASHFPGAGTAWGQVGATPLDDLQSLGEVIRKDGNLSPNELLMGETAFVVFLRDAQVQAHFDNRRIDQGTINRMQRRSDGGLFRGVVEIGNYEFDVWTYAGDYEHPQTGTITPYLAPEKVVVRAGAGRMDAFFGYIPNIGRELGMSMMNRLPELPGRFTSGRDGMDMFPNVWLTADGRTIQGSVASRPVLVPTAIDTFGCLDTGL